MSWPTVLADSTILFFSFFTANGDFRKLNFEIYDCLAGLRAVGGSTGPALKWGFFHRFLIDHLMDTLRVRTLWDLELPLLIQQILGGRMCLINKLFINKQAHIDKFSHLRIRMTSPCKIRYKPCLPLANLFADFSSY